MMSIYSSTIFSSLIYIGDRSITQDGKPVMVALSVEQFESLLETWDILSDKEFWPMLQTGIQQAESGDVVSLESVKAELGLDSTP